MQTYLTKHLVSKSIVLPSLLLKTRKNDWKNKPSDWPNIRKDCPKNSIALYAAHKEDYSQYDNLGFIVTCEDGYNVFIDGAQYGSTYASGTQCSITWSTSGISTGDDITTPSVLKAHKIWIEPATQGNNITAFKCSRVAASGTEEQGILWIHFNLNNAINLSKGFAYTEYCNDLLTAVTAKKNLIIANGLDYCFYNALSLEYLPKINYSNVSDMTNFITKASNISKVDTDISTTNTLTKVDICGDDTHFLNNIKCLRVSNESPFNNATSPQINISYTGMDRNALVQLFNDLPTVTGGQIINITGCTGANNLSGTDMDIAINKGWTITGGKDHVIENGVLVWANPKLYLESSGTQYIDTGVYADDSTGFKLKVSVQSSETYNDYMYIGSKNNESNQAIHLEQYGDSAHCYLLNSWNRYYSDNNSWPNIVNKIGNYINIELNYKNGRTCKLDGTSIDTYLSTETLTTQTRSLFLYARNNGFPTYFYSGKMGSVEITQGNNIIRHFVPVPLGLKIDNFTVPSNGMFDIVNQQFYANLGTGTFSYGKDS